MLRRGFTLMEVNLAILVMAGGILAMVSLYSFGYRENRQSREDVVGAALADAVLSPMIMAASSTNLNWTSFQSEFFYPSEEGWLEYLDDDGAVNKDAKKIAKDAYNEFIDKMERCGANDIKKDFANDVLNNDGIIYGIVVSHEANSPMVHIAFRAAKHTGQLLSAPIYATAVRFQGRIDGDPDK